MKNIIVLVALIAAPALAQDAPQQPPAPKKEIKVCETYDGSAYKVVPINEKCESKEPTASQEPAKEPVKKPKPKPKIKPKPCPACKPQIQIVEKEKEKIVEKTTYKKWRIYGLAGYGQDGLKSKTQPEGEQVDKYHGAVFGGGVDYHINPNWSVGVQGLSNETGLFSLGYSFGSAE